MVAGHIYRKEEKVGYWEKKRKDCWEGKEKAGPAGLPKSNTCICYHMHTQIKLEKIFLLERVWK